MASVTFEQVTKIYPNGHPALHDLNLAIRDGELLVVVGPSGCGKSTFLRVLAGLEDITRGTLRIGAVVANQLSPQARNIAMVFQDYALYPTMTVRENLVFPLKMRKLKPADRQRRVAWVAEMLNLGDVLERRPRELSGGQRQRVAMGRALVREPTVFLLDEPLSNLDAKLRAQVRAEIGDLQQRTGTTMVHVTHDQVEAMTLGQRIVVLHEGRIQQVAEPRTLYATPATPFVAGFIGSPPMNVFTARLQARPGPGWDLLVGGQRVAWVTAERAKQCLKEEGSGLRDGITLTAGLRPEALSLASDTGKPGFFATVLTCEYLGHETLVHCRPGRSGRVTGTEKPWIVRLPGLYHHNRGETLRLAAPDPQDVHLFREDEPD